MRALEATVSGLIVLVAALVLLNAVALKFGVDSRDGNDWSEHPRP